MKDRLSHELCQRQQHASRTGLTDDIDAVQIILDGSLGKCHNYRPLNLLF